MSTNLAARIIGEHAAIAHALPTDVIDAGRRRKALERLAEKGLPNNREENWRYANLHTLEHVQFSPSMRTPADATVSAADLPPPIEGYARYTFVDGRFAPELSHAPGEFSLASLHDASAPAARLPSPPFPALADNPTALLNEAFATDGGRIVATDTGRPLCIEVIFLSSTASQGSASYPRLEILAQPGTRLGLIERHLSQDKKMHLVSGTIAVNVAQGASVDHYRLQQTGSETTWLDTLGARLSSDAAYRLHLANLGGQSTRSTVQIALEGRGASVLLNAISVPDRLQVHDVFATIEHAAPDTRTEQRFRGIAAERARVAFNGKVVVRPGAHRTVSRQSLRGLLAGPQAEVDVRPQLEIHTDDVQCSHGATAGKLDDDMLFYLLSRGLERETAQRLLKWAFLEDVIAKIELPELRRQVERTLVAQMADAAVLQEML